MTNTLIKNTSTTYTPGSPGFPAFPGQPWIPAHWVTEMVSVTRLVTPPLTYTIFYVQPTRLGYPSGFSGVTSFAVISHLGEPWYAYYYFFPSGPPYYVTETVPVTRWVPEQPYLPPTPGVPATPAMVTINYNFGWNSSARSIPFLPSDGYTTFTLPGSAGGVVCGLNDVDTGSGYFEINYAFHATHGVLKIVENGVEVAWLGEYAGTDVLKIKRLLGVVTYYVNDVLKYTSATPCTVPLFLDASLYTGGDRVDSPTLTDLFSGSSAAELLPLRSAAWVTGAAPNMSAASLCPLESSSRVAYGAAVSLEPLVSLSADWFYAEARATLEPMTGYSFGGAGIPAYALSDVMIGPLVGGAHGFTGEIGSSEASLAPLISMSSDHNYADSRGQLPTLTSYCFGVEGNNNATIHSTVYASSEPHADTELLVVMTETGVIAGVLAVGVVVDAAVASQATVSDPVSLQTIYGVLMQTSVTAGSLAPGYDSTPVVWAVNYDTSASSRYEDFPFNSFGQIGGVYYGMAEDGLYSLDGDPAPVAWSVDLGKQKLNGNVLSRLADCFIGVASSGTVYLKVTCEGVEYVYSSRTSNEHMKTQRIDIGRGLRANFFEFELHGGDATELASVEFVAAKMTRRV